MWLRAEMISSSLNVRALTAEELTEVFEIRKLGKLYDDCREAEKNVEKTLKQHLAHRKLCINTLDSLMEVAMRPENEQSEFWKTIRGIIETSDIQ